MLDDDAGWLGEALHAFQCGVGVGNVVIGQLLALQLHCSGDAGFGWQGLTVEGRALMRVLAVAHVLDLDELAVEGAREGRPIFGAQGIAVLIDSAQVVGNHAVIGSGMFERLQRQVKTLGVGHAAVAQAVEDARVVAGVDHDGDILVVLGGRANHGRSTDIDILDGIRQSAARSGDGGSEGVEVDHHHVDRLDAVFGHDRSVQVATTEDAAVNLRVQGLDPTVHHLREAGVIGHFHGINVAVAQQLVGATGGEDFHTQ